VLSVNITNKALFSGETQAEPAFFSLFLICREKKENSDEMGARD